MITTEIILFVLLAYLTGEFPSAVWVGRTFYNTDVREYGSGNAGATNTFRVLGKGAGIPVLLMDILKEAETVGDKVLVFSQSLLSLDLIQEFLRTIDESNDKGGYGAGDMESYLGSWQEGRDYYRMDGSTSPEVRKRWCNYFNKVRIAEQVQLEASKNFPPKMEFFLILLRRVHNNQGNKN